MRKTVCAIATTGFALLAVLSTAHRAAAQDATMPYSNIAPVNQFLMEEKRVEIALARSAAPQSISRDADVLVLGRHGFESAVKGKNGFVCIVARSWKSAPDADFWNPKVLSPCLSMPGRAFLSLTRHEGDGLDSGRTNEGPADRDHRRRHREKGTASNGTRGDVLHDVEARIRWPQRATLAFPPLVLLFRHRPRDLGSQSAGFSCHCGG